MVFVQISLKAVKAAWRHILTNAYGLDCISLICFGCLGRLRIGAIVMRNGTDKAWQESLKISYKLSIQTPVRFVWKLLNLSDMGTKSSEKPTKNLQEIRLPGQHKKGNATRHSLHINCLSGRMLRFVISPNDLAVILLSDEVAQLGKILEIALVNHIRRWAYHIELGIISVFLKRTYLSNEFIPDR